MTKTEKTKTADRLKAGKSSNDSSVVVGVVVGLENDLAPHVSFPGCPREDGLLARTTTPLKGSDVGVQVALLFEAGDKSRPVIIGKIQLPISVAVPSQKDAPVLAELDGERVTLSAKKEIVLKCGKASITLTRAGKIIIRGAYVSSGSSGVNKLKGASVQIN